MNDTDYGTIIGHISHTPWTKNVATWIQLSEEVRASFCLITAWAIICQEATSYLTLADALGSFSFLEQPCQKTLHVVMEKSLVC